MAYFIHDFTQVQDDNFIKEILHRFDKLDRRFELTHPARSLPMEPEINYFGVKQVQGNVVCQYDQVYRQKNEYDQKLHREDGRYKRVAVNQWREESDRVVPVRGNSLYGHRQPIDVRKTTKAARLNIVEGEFFRPRHVFPPEEKTPH